MQLGIGIFLKHSAALKGKTLNQKPPGIFNQQKTSGGTHPWKYCKIRAGGCSLLFMSSLFSEHLLCVSTPIGTRDTKVIQTDMVSGPRELMRTIKLGRTLISLQWGCTRSVESYGDWPHPARETCSRGPETWKERLEVMWSVGEECSRQ